jgi:acetyltransferase-like isoleucine patch superfamily enzyme
MPSVTIGENSIIGAFSLVNEDIPPNVVAFGIPAKVVRRLTDDEISVIHKAITEVEASNESEES